MPLCFTQDQQQTEANALSEVLNSSRPAQPPLSQSAQARQTAADPQLQPSLTSVPNFPSLNIPSAVSFSALQGNAANDGGAAPAPGQPPLAEVGPPERSRTPGPGEAAEALACFIQNSGERCPTQVELMSMV